jgi:hypothetical protein
MTLHWSKRPASSRHVQASRLQKDKKQKSESNVVPRFVCFSKRLDGLLLDKPHDLGAIDAYLSVFFDLKCVSYMLY